MKFHFSKKNKFNQLIRRLSIFDFLIVFVLIASVVYASSFIFKKEKWLKVEIKVRPEEIWWDYKPVPYWVADSIKVGDMQYDSLGRKIAEVLATEIYESGGGKKDVYITTNLKVSYEKKKKIDRFNNQTVKIGKPLNLELGNVGLQGLVMFIEGVEKNEEEVNMEVETLWLMLPSWLPEAISVGDQMKDNNGKVVAEVLEKEVNLAETTTVNDRGEILIKIDPLNRDVILKLRILAKRKEDIYYFREVQVVKVGNALWIKLPKIELHEVTITKILN